MFLRAPLCASGTASCRVYWMLYRYCTWQLSAFAADVDDPSPRLLVAAQGAGGARSSRVPDVASSTGSHGNWAKFGPNLDQGWINFGHILNQFWTRFGPTRPPAHIVSGAGTPREETYTNIQGKRVKLHAELHDDTDSPSGLALSSGQTLGGEGSTEASLAMQA